MTQNGYLQVHAYTSAAKIPLKGVAVIVRADDGTALAARLSDRSGQIDPISIPAPQLPESLTPGSSRPFSTVTINAQLKDYEQIQISQVQIFADTLTVQDLEMIPLSEFPAQRYRTESFTVAPQNL